MVEMLALGHRALCRYSRVHAPLHQADHPLREHGGLARAGGGGHDQIPLFLYGALLFYGPVHFVPSASANKSAMVIFRVSRS